MAQVAGRTQPLPIGDSRMSSASRQPWSQSSLPRNLQTDSKTLPNPPHAFDRPPTPPPKDSPTTPQTPMGTGDSSSAVPSSVDLTNYFRPGHLSRAGSVYSLSRISFTSQISQLTAIHLPDAASLKGQISAITTSTAAARALSEAADQIQRWIQKATDVLAGLDAGDDADWAAAAGRDGLEEVDQSIARFEGLIEVYVSAVEELQLRSDAHVVAPEDLRTILTKLEKVTTDWQSIKKSLDDVKHQVGLALEWEQLGDVDLGEVGIEIEDLSRLVFEMEERRHHSSSGFFSAPDQGVDLEELEIIVHEAPQRDAETPTLHKQFNVASDFQSSPIQSPGVSNVTDESSVLGLFARMQPLKATLDFLPMKLSAFKARAGEIFPTACDQLEERRNALEAQWQQLEADAECLRRELGEDRWNLVFRNAGKQALKLIDSVERSLTKVDESLGNDTHLKHSSSTLKKIENYEAKKTHYCPAIDRVLSIIERGVKDRLTMNGEIIRLRADIRQKWQTLQKAIKHMDTLLDEYAADQPANQRQQQQLRDSLSSIISTERSLDNSLLLTPGSSPPSSVVSANSRKGSMHETPKLALRIKSTLSSETSGQMTPEPAPRRERRNSNLPVPVPTHATPVARTITGRLSHGSSPNTSFTPSSTKSTPRSVTQPARPRWNYSKQSGGDYDVSQYYASLKAKAAASKTPRQSSATSSILPSSPLSGPTIPGSTTSQRTSARPSLSRKASDLSLSAGTRPGQRTSSAAFVSSYLSRDNSPLSVRKRSDNNLAHGSAYSPPTQYQSSPPLSHVSPRTSLGPTDQKSTSPAGAVRVGRSRTGSMIPLPADRARAPSAIRNASDVLHHAVDDYSSQI